MIKQPNMKLIGLFILSSIAVVLFTLGYFLKSKFNSDETTVVMYFDESVKGLDVGAPVLFKGVKVGEVSSVRLRTDPKTLQFLISVYAKIYDGESEVTDTGYEQEDEQEIDEREILKRLIDAGLRAQLALNSMITGQLLIELDMHPDSPVVLHSNAKNNYEIPTINSPFATISKRLQVIPVAKIAHDIHHITKSIDKELPPLLKHMNETLTTVNTILKDNKNNTAKMFGQVTSAAQAFDSLITENSANLSTMLDSFSAAAISMKNLTDYLQINPSSIITGKGN